MLKKSSKISDEEIERLEAEHFYSPEKGNVAFASAYDNWAITLASFAPRIASKFPGANPYILKNYLWGTYYFKPSEKRVVKQPPTAKSQEMFVQFVMGPLVELYRRFFTDEIMG